MPKKFQGENSKSATARSRKAEKAAEEKCKKEKEADDLYWRDDNKQVNRKLQRKDDKEKKRLDEVQRKQENRLLAEQEGDKLTPVPLPQKVTVYQLQNQKEKCKEEEENSMKQKVKTHISVPLVENLNRDDEDVVSASGIEQAISALSTADDGKVDQHPERRMAAAFRVFEEERLPQIKKENPSLRLTQLKQLLSKEWQKSPQNPINKNQ